MSLSDEFNADIIQSQLDTKIIGKKILVYKSTSSTNDIVLKHIENAENNGLCVFAESQTKGRGRRGNKWFSAGGQSILCSILLIDFPYGAELLTLCFSVAAVEAINKCGKIKARIKWPNDVIVNGKKLAGILVESKITNGRFDYVIGIGINCHQDQEFFKTVKLCGLATSIDLENGALVNRNALAIELLNLIDRWLIRAKSDNDLVVNRWQALSSLLGHYITLEYDGEEYSGTCIGLNPAQGLIVQTDRGPVKIFTASHTRIVRQCH